MADMAASGGVVRTICDVFESEGFAIPAAAGEAPQGGVRRWYVEQFLAGADFSKPATQAAFARAAAAAVDDWGQAPPWAGGYDGTEGPKLTDDARAFIRSAQRDGIPLDDEGKLTTLRPGAAITLDAYLAEPAAAQEGLERIARNLDEDPYVAIGSCKELVETVCKHILDAEGIAYDRGDSLMDLYNKVANELGLHRDSVPDSAKASKTAKRILQNVATAVQGLAELRNEIGSGHGKTFRSAAQPRHARLALNATRTVVEFLLDTWVTRRQGRPSPAPADRTGSSASS